MLSRIIRYVFVCFFIAALGSAPKAQSKLALGQWEQYLPFNISNDVTGGNGSIFYSTGTAILVLRADQSTEFWTKINRLNDVDISAIYYFEAQKVLVVGYENGNLDLVYEDRTVNKVDLLINQGIQTSKAVHSIFSDAKNRIYLSCPFGLVVFDLEQNAFVSTLFTPAPVAQLTEFEDKLYMALGNEGIYYIDQRQSNFSDFGAWKKLDTDQGLPENYSAFAVSAFDDKLYADLNGELVRIDQGMELQYSQRGFRVKYLYSGADHLYAGLQCLDPGGMECKGKLVAIDKNELLKEAAANCVDRPEHIFEAPNGTLWFADRFSILKRAVSIDQICTTEAITGPPSHFVQNIKVIDEGLYITTGGADDNMTYRQRLAGTYLLKDNIWTEFSSFKVPELQGVRDHYDILPHPDGNKIYISTIFSGLLEYDGEKFTVYNESNSPLTKAIGDVGAERVFGIAFDGDKNLWMTNFGSASPIKVLKSNGEWQSFDPPGNNDLSFIAIDNKGNKWISSEDTGTGFVVFHEGDPADPDDDRLKRFDTGNSELENNRVRCILADPDGTIWVGTDQGVVVFSCADPFDESCTGNRPKVLQDGFLGYLLENERVNTIAVDPANRKWCGTDNGIFLLSASGDEQLLHFNTQNSPLFSDRIIELEIDPKTGILYIGTDRGVMAYRAEALQGKAYHQKELISYPNPVRPDYDGPIAIKGLANNSKVKITNVQGQIVFETLSLGGQVIWDGRDFNGRRVQSGVYYIFGSVSDFFGKTEGATGKLLFIGGDK